MDQYRDIEKGCDTDIQAQMTYVNMKNKHNCNNRKEKAIYLNFA